MRIKKSSSVNDGSTDKTGQILDEIRKEWGADKLQIFHLSKSVGKKQAVEVASKVARGEVYAFMDSDCDMAHDAVEKAAKIFVADRQLGALATHGRVRGGHSGNLLQKMQDVYVDGSCRAVKGAETQLFFGHLLLRFTKLLQESRSSAFHP